jgi:hypothetical protein
MRIWKPPVMNQTEGSKEPAHPHPENLSSPSSMEKQKAEPGPANVVVQQLFTEATESYLWVSKKQASVLQVKRKKINPH